MPNALALAVAPLVTVAVSVNVSPLSASASSVVATRTCTDVLPAAIVTPAAGTATHALPLKNSKTVPVSVPTVAEPLLKAGVNVVALALAPDRLTVNTAKPPSTTVVSDTLSAGVASSSTSVVPTLLLTALTTRFSKLPPVAETIVTVKPSVPSNAASSIVATSKSALEAPAGIVTVATPL